LSPVALAFATEALDTSSAPPAPASAAEASDGPQAGSPERSAACRAAQAQDDMAEASLPSKSAARAPPSSPSWPSPLPDEASFLSPRGGASLGGEGPSISRPGARPSAGAGVLLPLGSGMGRILAARICACDTLDTLRALATPFSDGEDPSSRDVVTWMIWMVHRVALGDPLLVVLDFSGYAIPSGDDEPRILRKLFSVLTGPSCLEQLCLAGCGLSGEDVATGFARMLRRSRSVRVLDLSSNKLDPDDLRAIFVAVAESESLEELRCNNQLCEGQVGAQELKLLDRSLKRNWRVRKLGLDLVDRHWRDQITRTLIRNVELARVRRVSAQKQLTRGRR